MYTDKLRFHVMANCRLPAILALAAASAFYPQTTLAINHVCSDSPTPSGCYGDSNEILMRTLTFAWSSMAPDNFRQQVITINGQFPGPELRVKQNTTLILNVVNKLGRGFALHFHGIHQFGSLTSDGVPLVTQTEIPADGCYRYEIFTGTQVGTFHYHAHTRFDLVWAFGALIIEDALGALAAEYEFSEERTVLLSQCFHEPVDEIFDGIFENPFPDVPDPASLLINGRSWGIWEEGDGGGEGFEVINVRQGETYRFRVIGLGVDSMLSFRIAKHSLRVMEADGILVELVETDHLQLNTAQRYSVLVTMDQPIGNYEIGVAMIPSGGPANGYAILHYEGAPTPNRKVERPVEDTPDVELDQWILPQLHPNPRIFQSEVYPIPTNYTREIVIESRQIDHNGGAVRFTINGQLYEEDTIPLLRQLQDGANFGLMEPKVFEITVGQALQVVFQNTFADDGECEQHPWHLHGHSFYVVGQGPDAYDHDRDKEQLDSNARRGNLELRDVTTVFVNHTIDTGKVKAKEVDGGTPCGWQAIRFTANNPGLWLVHCHLTAHMDLGKKFVFYEHDQRDPLFLDPCMTESGGIRPREGKFFGILLLFGAGTWVVSILTLYER